jgi:hypothetical protein
MKRIGSATAAALFIMLSLPAFAESSSEAIRVFGLIGTWSRDCAATGVPRLVFASPMFGNPTAAFRNGTADIESAVRVTDKKLKMIHGPSIISGKISDLCKSGTGVNNSDPMCKSTEVVIERVGEDFKIGNAVFEKCLN